MPGYLGDNYRSVIENTAVKPRFKWDSRTATTRQFNPQPPPPAPTADQQAAWRTYTPDPNLTYQGGATQNPNANQQLINGVYVDRSQEPLTPWQGPPESTQAVFTNYPRPDRTGWVNPAVYGDPRNQPWNSYVAPPTARIPTRWNTPNPYDPRRSYWSASLGQWVPFPGMQGGPSEGTP